MNNYNLDFHCQMIMEDYIECIPIYQKMEQLIVYKLKESFSQQNILLSGMESRIKKEHSLAGKLAKKGSKYQSIRDLTDIVGVRLITFYTDEVDKIAAMVETIFDVDWNDSIDKRKMYELNSFGYMSLHYICRIPKSVYEDPEHPEINELRFEIQMRTALQHVWACMDHDMGYKSKIDIPPQYVRNYSRLAGILELVDEQFNLMRKEINEYRRRVEQLVSSSNFDELTLNGDTFLSYLNIEPFKHLTERIAAVNQAEIYYDSIDKYLEVFQFLKFKTIGDIERMRTEYQEDAYLLAMHQLGGTDIDIIAASVALQNLCTIYILKSGGGEILLTLFYDILGGNHESNILRAKQMIEQTKKINLI